MRRSKPRRLAVSQMPWDFYRVGLRRRPVERILSPQLFAHQGERIGEGQMSLAVPGCLTKGTRCLRHPAMRTQIDQREHNPTSAGVVPRIAKSDYSV